jgi:hypothetical protein
MQDTYGFQPQGANPDGAWIVQTDFDLRKRQVPPGTGAFASTAIPVALNVNNGPSVRRNRGRLMLRLTGIRFRTAPAQNSEQPHPGFGEWGRDALNWPIWGVYIVHTLGVGSGRMWVGSGRIPYVSGGVQCLRGLECSSSPTSGTCFPCSGA